MKLLPLSLVHFTLDEFIYFFVKRFYFKDIPVLAQPPSEKKSCLTEIFADFQEKFAVFFKYLYFITIGEIDKIE